MLFEQLTSAALSLLGARYSERALYALAHFLLTTCGSNTIICHYAKEERETEMLTTLLRVIEPVRDEDRIISAWAAQRDSHVFIAVVEIGSLSLFQPDPELNTC